MSLVPSTVAGAVPASLEFNQWNKWIPVFVQKGKHSLDVQYGCRLEILVPIESWQSELEGTLASIPIGSLICGERSEMPKDTWRLGPGQSSVVSSLVISQIWPNTQLKGLWTRLIRSCSGERWNQIPECPPPTWRTCCPPPPVLSSTVIQAFATKSNFF